MKINRFRGWVAELGNVLILLCLVVSTFGPVQSVSAAAGNSLGGVNVGNGNFTSGETYSINKDTTAFTTCAGQFQIPETECNALVALYNSTNGAGWTDNTRWLQIDTPCSWFGITCTGETNVTEVNLAANNLMGTLPPEVGDLTNLIKLELAINQLTDSIPSQVGNLSNLTRLSLGDNQLSGSIPPELGYLTKLNVLGLGNNQLTGSIPIELGNLENLIGLFLHENQLIGTIPSQLGNLTNLTGLYLTNNQLSGSIPAEIGNLSQLKWLNLYGNQLTGSIPSELGNLTNLVIVWLAYNQLNNFIPIELGNLINLDELHLNNNQLTGSIPPQLGNLTKLTSLTLNNNQLMGSIPSQLGNLTNLTSLTLNDNQFTGLIPSQLGNLTNLTWMRLDNNQLTGFIPSQLGNLPSLYLLRLENNLLTGSIPSQLGNLISLQELRLNNNYLVGSIPSQIGNLTNLHFIFLDANYLSGEFPVSITNLTNLLDLTFDCGITSSDPTVIAFIDNLVPGWQNNICPVISSITRSDPNPTSSSNANFTVTFSESVTGVNTTLPFNDFILTTTGIAGAIITGVTPVSGTTYTVTVNTGSGNGTIRLDVVDDNSIADAAGNPLGGVNVGDGNFTAGEVYTVDDWTLIWSDEFNGFSVDTNNWNFDTGNGVNGWGNNELECYTDGTNAFIQDDGADRVLVIQARKENVGGCQYTSTRMTTKEKHEFKYGKIEARMKLPLGQGLWPAFWMLGSSYPAIPWPASGEIDIMEHKNNDDYVYGAVHWDDNGINPPASYSCTSSSAIGSLDVTQYHTYSIVWDPDYIRWFVDGTQYCEILIQNSASNDMEEFRKPYFILLNLAVGGDFPGSPDGTTPFLANMYVDYVRAYCSNIHTSIGSVMNGCYELSSGEEIREYYNFSGGPVKVESTNDAKIVSAIRLQSFANNTLYSFVETMGVPQGLLSHKYYFPTYNNTWGPLNSQLRFGNLNDTDIKVKVTIGTDSWTYLVPSHTERREYLAVSSGPVIIESLDPVTELPAPDKKIVAAIRLQSYGNNILYSFSETMGIPVERLSNIFYFPTYNNTWGPLNSQLRFGNLNNIPIKVKVTIGTDSWTYDVPANSERREYLAVSGGPVIIQSLDPVTLTPDPAKKIIAAIRLQSYTSGTLYSFIETMGVPEGSLSHKYYFPTYNNTWAPLNSQLRFGNLNDTDIKVKVTIGTTSWIYDVPAHTERREYLAVSGGPVIIESLDPVTGLPAPDKKIVAAIRLQSFTDNILYSFSETTGIPVEQLSDIYYFPTYNNTWAPLNSQLRFGVP